MTLFLYWDDTPFHLMWWMGGGKFQAPYSSPSFVIHICDPQFFMNLIKLPLSLVLLGTAILGHSKTRDPSHLRYVKTSDHT